MTSQTPEELDDQLFDAVYAWQDETYQLPAAIAPALAAIRRHAAADALRTQAKVLGMKRAGLLRKSTDPFFVGTPMAATWRDMSQQAGADAGTLYRAADDMIAEGWTEHCAAEFRGTWEEPGYRCETPVEHEGDYCPRHEPADDYDRDAE